MSGVLDLSANPLVLDESVEWAPRWYTKPLKRGSYLNEAGEECPVYNRLSLAPMLITFAETYLSAIRGMRANQKLTLTRWQHWLVHNILELDDQGSLRYHNYLVLVGRKNGKTFMTSLIALFALLQAPLGAEIYSAAKDRQQARIVFENIVSWIRQVPALAEVLEITDSKNKVANKITGAFYRALSADANAAAGYAPYIVIADELGEWDAQHTNRRSYAFWAALTTGSADRPEALVIGISTAGESVDNSLLGDLYKRGKAAAEGNEKDQRFGFACWEADIEGGDDPSALSTWKKANPNLAEGLINIEQLKSDEQGAEATNIGLFYRYHLNVWSKVSGFPYMPATYWAAAEVEQDIPKGAQICVGFDGSAYRDATGIVIIDYNTGLAKTFRLWEKPMDAGDDWLVDREGVAAAFAELHRDYQVMDIWADTHLWEADFALWKRRNRWRFADIPMSPPRKRKHGAELLDAVANQRTLHRSDDADLTRHIMAAVYDELQGFRKTGGRDSREKIDLLVCLMLASACRDFYQQKQQRKNELKSANGGLIGF